MLTSLRVRDLAVLEDVEVSLGEGLTVLTGETGAGKSLVVDALSLLSGERGDASMVRAGAERLIVEGAFTSDDPRVSAALTEAGLREGGPTGAVDLVVRREVAAGGKGRLFVNGSPASLRTLTDLSPGLLVLYGQAEARELLDPGVPRELLDRFGGVVAHADEVAQGHARFRTLEAERERIAAAAKDRAARLETLEFQIREIDAVKPVAGEESALAAEKLALASVEKRGRFLTEAVAALDSEDSGALSALRALRRSLQSLGEVDPASAPRAAEAGELAERAADLSATLARELDRLEADPERLAAVSERLDALAKVKRKYGATLDEVLAHRETIGRERDELTDLEGALGKAEKAAKEAFDAFRKAALELSAERIAAAPRLARAVKAHLVDLALPKAPFGVAVTRRPDPESPFRAGNEAVGFGPHGIDHVAFTFAPNPGEPARSLAKIASGGELSRVQLAVAAALGDEEGRAEARHKGRRATRNDARGRPVRTFVFDEVDAGVSGATAEAVGKKLRALAAREQILVVTHLPQVAALGQHHFAVTKETSGGRTKTHVTELDAAGRVEAVAAMLAGANVGDAARKQARQLLSAARKS